MKCSKRDVRNARRAGSAVLLTAPHFGTDNAPTARSPGRPSVLPAVTALPPRPPPTAPIAARCVCFETGTLSHAATS
jgi:hypothetical protein